jgi:uncharacterized protein with von Willebrand factor type A (vWA) domain
MSKMHGGKGDTPRPLGVSLEQFDANFDAIFGKKKTPKEMYEEKKEQVLYDPRDKAGKGRDEND